MQFKTLFALALAAVSAVAVPTGGGGGSTPPPHSPPPHTPTPTPTPPAPTPTPPAPTPTPPAPTPIPPSQCNTGPIQCCNSVQEASSPSLTSILALLGINVGDITGLVGVTCSPISVIGVPGNSCNAQPVCCSNNTFNGVVAIGCTPININL